MTDFLEQAGQAKTVSVAKELLAEQIEITKAIDQALDLAIELHADQYRISGDPYVIHPIAVAAITASFSADETMVIAALLHDVVEDTGYPVGKLEKLFSEDVRHIVEGLTKIVTIRDENLASSTPDDRINSSALSFRKMLIASIEDVRVLIIKLCDRLHNMLTLDALPPSKQQRISEETLLVYAPIAHRLGISKIKNELEDLSFKYIYPGEYQKIDEYIRSNDQSLHFQLNAFIEKVKNTLHQAGYHWENFEVIGRVKHYYSIYLKMQRKGIEIDEVLDLLAIRIIVKDALECYEALGAIHLEFTPLISRFKDYIALPKENGYQTIHSTLFGDEGIVEAQIRTRQMHQLAEYGVAAHWKYKGGLEHVNLEWLKGLNYQNESVEEFYELAKSDLFSEEISVFTPEGDYFTLPKDSVALDFAYAIHSEIGETATGALVHKEKASLLTILKNGDVVKIITGGKPRMHCSWENTVKTSKAKSGIRSQCRKRIREVDENSSYNILAMLFAKPSSVIKDIVEEDGGDPSIAKAAVNLDALKEKINNILQSQNIHVLRFWELLKKGYKRPQVKDVEHIRFYTNKPIDGIVFDHCCHPKVGDDVVAFYKHSKAIIHHKLCMNAYDKIMAGEVMLFAQWNSNKMPQYRLIVSLPNQKGELAKLLMKLSTMKLNITGIEFGISSSESAEYCNIEVESESAKVSDIENALFKKFKLIDIVALNDAYNHK
ncbi:MAG: bifunctional (p)ppGpp synthetase/guanosine-3',5'-bis(diphosphate) 3'-pyrophosphohydrolase [Sulfurovum sp.]|nr:bifunctional (p)ppGpp synthetase/guanosine-3',5'-bis(diphosphate) 3'-pyrophosphohydrolase [Sulfurovum sp.]